MSCNRTTTASAPHDSATRFRGGSCKSSPPPAIIVWAQTLDFADRFARTSIYADTTTQIGVWRHWLYYTASRIPYFSGRKSRHPLSRSRSTHLNFVLLEQDRLVLHRFRLCGLGQLGGQMAKIPNRSCDARLHRSLDMVHLYHLGGKSRPPRTSLPERHFNTRSRGTHSQ